MREKFSKINNADWKRAAHFTTVSAVDLGLTIYGLQQGLTEGNQLANHIIESNGSTGIILYKAGAVVLANAAYLLSKQTTRGENMSKAMSGCSALMWGVVAFNIANIMLSR